MFKRIIAASIVTITVTNSGFAVLATAAPRVDQIARATKPVVSYLSTVATNNPMATVALGTALFANAAAKASPNSMSHLAQASAGALVGEASKKLADNFFEAYIASSLTKNSHSAAISKKVVSGAVGYLISQAFAIACAYATNTKANPGAKLQAAQANKYFSTGMLLAYARNDLYPLWSMWKAQLGFK